MTSFTPGSAFHSERKRTPFKLRSMFSCAPGAFLAMVFTLGTVPAFAQICPGNLAANCVPYLSSAIDVYAEIYDDGLQQSASELIDEFKSSSDLLSGTVSLNRYAGGGFLNPEISAFASASAQTGYGVNRARAISTGSGRGTYLRDSEDASGGVEDYFSTTSANAYSEWQEVWTANSGGSFSTNFRIDGKLDHITTGPIEGGFVRQESGGSWGFEVVIFSLDEFLPDPSCGSCTLVKRTQWRVTGSEPGPYDQTLFIDDFAMQAGHRYLMRVELSVNGGEWVETDFFNTAMMGDLVLEDGLALTAASGTSYRIATSVPEPSTYAMMLGGLLAMGWLARRRTLRAI